MVLPDNELARMAYRFGRQYDLISLSSVDAIVLKSSYFRDITKTCVVQPV
jgi:hypothetical protein